MSVRRLDHAGVVVEDLKAAVAFFEELGLEVEGEAMVEGDFPDRLLGLEGVVADIVMLRTPDGQGRIEVSTFRTPPLTSGAQTSSVNTPGIPRLTFVVDDVDDTIERLGRHGGELMGEIVEYHDVRYGYVRGPSGTVLGLVEEIG